MNIFERAARKKLRFASDRGDLTTEQLFDLGLEELDQIARAVNSNLKAVSEESFIETAPHPEKADLSLRLDLLKHAIQVKQEAAQAAEDRAVKAEKRRKLIEALDAKEDEALTKKSRAQLLKELEALDE